MPTVRCPQCSAAVTEDSQHCPECGYPLAWRAESEERNRAPTGNMMRRPDEAASEAETTRLAPAAGDGGETPPPDDPDPDPGPAEPTVTCWSCGAVNPAGRTLCERCGVGLDATDEVTTRRRPAWVGRIGWSALVVLVVLVAGAGAVAWVLLRSPEDTGDDGGMQPTAEAGVATEEQTPQPPAEIVLEEGDTGPQVTEWQELLVAAGLQLEADGHFGPRTAQATRRFQMSIGEEPTGQVTTTTMAAARRAGSLRTVEVFLVREGALEPVQRRVEEAAPARGALRALFAAPLQAEREDGLRTAIPAGASLQDIEIDNGTAVVTIEGFGADPGPESLSRRVEQVVRTLAQFGSIETVRFALPEADMRALEEAGVPLTVPVRQSDG